MKSKTAEIRRNVSKVPHIRYENLEQTSLTSFAGLVIFQKLFQQLNLNARLTRELAHLAGSASYGAAVIFLWLVVHLLLGSEPVPFFTASPREIQR